ncbi:MAG: fibrinogen-like YCDxxxxGGGW domain-containing protein [Candidatus Gracilibacteria bacterium]|nr:fibrinogen-like YCDxxxxGGGW domain-containing protein [Candidatus Gracilibacteria bacterium]
MKKVILFLSLILSGIYLTNFISAISITKNSGEVLDNTTWTNISNLTNKIDVTEADIKLNGKLYVTGKICDNSGKCFGDIELGTEGNPGKSCKDILDNSTGIVGDGVYWIKPEGYTGSAFETLCDMTTDGGGWTIISNINDTKRGIGVSNGNLTNIPNLSTFGTINSTTGNALHNGATALLFKSGNYKYSINNSSVALKCLKGLAIPLTTGHNGTIKKLGTNTITIPNFDHIGCNHFTYGGGGWRFGGNQGSNRITFQAFNNYGQAFAPIVNGVASSSYIFSVWVR